MMDWVKNWIISVTCVSILLAAVQCLMPPGGVKRVGQLTGGLLMLLAAASPLLELDLAELSLSLTELRMEQSGSSALLELENTRLVKEIIAEQTAAYIADKAMELGADCAVEVTYEYSEDGMAYPVAVTVTGPLTSEQRAELERWLEAELAVPREDQSYVGEEGS